MLHSLVVCGVVEGKVETVEGAEGPRAEMCEARRDRAGPPRAIQPIPTPEGLGGRLELEQLGAGGERALGQVEERVQEAD